jgi:hypothetical protein
VLPLAFVTLARSMPAAGMRSAHLRGMPGRNLVVRHGHAEDRRGDVRGLDERPRPVVLRREEPWPSWKV